MKLRLTLLALSLAVFSYPALAQAPSSAPAGSTGQCKDGSYTNAASKAGACRGHKGIQAWFAASSTTPAAKSAAPAPAPAKPSPGTAAPASATVSTHPAPGATPTTTPAPTTAVKPASNASPAPGGGPGMVWVNAETKVYHCPGDRYYGTTKDGKYMSEADAQKMGAHASRGKPCSAK